jgi:hypothetical protein
MSEFRNSHAGLGALLTPQDSALSLIDHQAFQFANLHSHEPTLVINNVVRPANPADKPLGALVVWNDNEIAPGTASVSTATPTWRSSLMSAMAGSAAVAVTP